MGGTCAIENKYIDPFKRGEFDAGREKAKEDHRQKGGFSDTSAFVCRDVSPYTYEGYMSYYGKPLPKTK